MIQLLPSLALALLPLPALPATQGEPAAQGDEVLSVASEVSEVTVFPESAMVRRTANVPAGGGTFVLAGLPWMLDPDSVRVRCVGGDVIGIETLERRSTQVDEERIHTLRSRLKELQRELDGVRDEGKVLASIERHLSNLLEAEAAQHVEEVGAGRADVATWRENLAFLGEQLASNSRAQREVVWAVEELELQIEDVRLQLGSSEAGTFSREVRVEIAGQGARGATIDVEYLVARAGWRPIYDLRTARDARSVELSYRAQVWQLSGEDWTDTQLMLSTARPRVGAQGPEPSPVWLGLYDPEQAVGAFAGRKAPAARAELRELGYTGEASDAAAPPPFAAVQSEGLSVRFRLASRETIQTREQPTTVLVGQATLAVEPEYYAVPALDENVWLRGRTANATEWTMLPGRAAVYFGADFVGHAELGAVQPGEELTLALGPDPALTLERVLTQDLHKEPGLLGSRVTELKGWRVHLENHGAAAAVRGVARVVVQEVLPRSRDERLKIELDQAAPPPSTDERWRQEREEEGVLTWVVDVPEGGTLDISWRMKASHPKSLEIQR
jgi:uncharacterized protein (TIGR02231 family)